MCVNGLIGGENISDAERQNALLDLAGQLVEQGRRMSSPLALSYLFPHFPFLSLYRKSRGGNIECL
jgi:hypothetical protein